MSFNPTDFQPSSGPDAADDIEGFNRALAVKESGGAYHLKNATGFVGRYQLGAGRLQDFNNARRASHTLEELITSPALQERIQQWHIEDIDKYIDRSGISEFIGKRIGDVQLSRNSCRAVAHLGGKQGLRNYLFSDGTYDPADVNGTRLSHYARAFAQETPSVPPNSPAAEHPPQAARHCVPQPMEAIYPKEGQDWAARDTTLGRHLPIGEPGALQLRMDGRTTPESLWDIADWLDVATAQRYAADEVDTFCNVYACDFCYLAGAYLPRLWAATSAKAGEAAIPAHPQGRVEMTANRLFDWLGSDGARFGWKQVASVTQLQEAANRGACALIIAKSQPGHHGHIAMICPERDAARAQRQGGQVHVPVQSQTLARSAQVNKDPQWWARSEFTGHGFWVHDRQTARPQPLRPGRLISAVSGYFFPRECAFLDAKLAIYRDEISRSAALPKEQILALAAGEDKRFFRHPGFDAIAILRAISRFCLRGKIEGASTVEQQLIRTFTGNRERSLRRKIGEILLAMRCSSALDKHVIAAIYLQNAYFGWRAQGRTAALKRAAFVKNSDLETAAWLVAALRYPVARSESDKRRGARQARVEYILNRLAEDRKRQPMRHSAPVRVKRLDRAGAK